MSLPNQGRWGPFKRGVLSTKRKKKKKKKKKEGVDEEQG